MLLAFILSFLFSNAQLVKDREIPEQPIKYSTQLQKKIQDNCKDLSDEDVIKYCIDLTRQMCEFSATAEKFDENRVTKQHCVGFARILKTNLHYAFVLTNRNVRISHCRGHIEYNGVNLNDASNLLPTRWKNFTKDHDFVEIRLKSNEVYYADASLDLLQRKK